MLGVDAKNNHLIENKILKYVTSTNRIKDQKSMKVVLANTQTAIISHLHARHDNKLPYQYFLDLV